MLIFKQSIRLLALPCLYLLATPVFAQSSLGIGVAEYGAPQTGFLAQISIWQRQFEMMMSNGLIAMQDDPSALFWFIGVSFIYGILHAAGPGHGKAVISSYLVANDESLKRGIVLAFFSSLLQALSAIILMGSVYFFLPIRWTTASVWMVKASFALIMLLGITMLISAIRQIIQQQRNAKQISAAQSVMATSSTPSALAAPSNPSTDRPKLNYKKADNAHEWIDTTESCAFCGINHIADPALLQKPLGWKSAISAIVSVGLRPCSGALLIMAFALSNGLYMGGILSVLFMALGTFITVSILAALAVKMKDLALRLTRKPTTYHRLKNVIMILAALFITCSGALLTFSPAALAG